MGELLLFNCDNSPGDTDNSPSDMDNSVGDVDNSSGNMDNSVDSDTATDSEDGRFICAYVLL